MIPSGKHKTMFCFAPVNITLFWYLLYIMMSVNLYTDTMFNARIRMWEFSSKKCLNKNVCRHWQICLAHKLNTAFQRKCAMNIFPPLRLTLTCFIIILFWHFVCYYYCGGKRWLQASLLPLLSSFSSIEVKLPPIRIFNKLDIYYNQWGYSKKKC